VANYVKQTWTDDVSSASAARMAYLETGIFDAHYQPAVRAYHNTTQSITNNTETTVAFNSERIDQAGNAADTMHDNSTNNSRLTCRYAGVYQIDTNIDWATGGTGTRFIAIRRNGTDYIARVDQINTGGTVAQSLSTKYPLAVNDYVEVRAFQNNGTALNIAASGTGTNQYACEFSMLRVG
jgi:hypothetical protein